MRSNRRSKWTSLCVAICLTVSQLGLNAFAMPGGGLSISISEGRNQVLDDRHRREIVVRVWNGDEPAAGAEVLFEMPQSGPGGLFTNGTPRITVQADAEGRARSGHMFSNNVRGKFNLAVVAFLGGVSAEAAVPLSSRPVSARQGKSGGGALKWILIAAAAGGVAVFLVTRKPGTDPPEPPTVTVGPPTIGP